MKLIKMAGWVMLFTPCKIFKAAESNGANKYPIEIVFDEDNLEYRK